jgi:hypothetical protein
VGSSPAGGMDMSLSVVCHQVELSASGWPLVCRSPTECGVSEYDREASIMRRPWPTRGCCAIGKMHKHDYFCVVMGLFTLSMVRRVKY